MPPRPIVKTSDALSAGVPSRAQRLATRSVEQARRTCGAVATRAEMAYTAPVRAPDSRGRILGQGRGGAGLACNAALAAKASASWSSRMMMRHAASSGVPWSIKIRTRAAIRSW